MNRHAVRKCRARAAGMLRQTIGRGGQHEDKQAAMKRRNSKESRREKDRALRGE